MHECAHRRARTCTHACAHAPRPALFHYNGHGVPRPTVNGPRPQTLNLKPPPPQNERVLFHYNGHGVPRPTVNGEIWVFNSRYTQYIPLSIYELQSWLGTPCIYVLDCSAAGLIINSFRAFMDQRQQDLRMVRGGGARQATSSTHSARSWTSGSRTSAW